MTLVPFAVPGVRVELSSSGESRDHRLRQAVARVVRTSADTVTVTRLCQRCGSTGHGRPLVCGVHVSVARSAGYELCAVSVTGAIGVDLESLARVTAANVDGVFLHSDERTRLEQSRHPHFDRAAIWVAKEALLKATGYGFATDPRELSLVIVHDGELELAASPSWLGLTGARVRTMSVSDDLVAALAVLH